MEIRTTAVGYREFISNITSPSHAASSIDCGYWVATGPVYIERGPVSEEDEAAIVDIRNVWARRIGRSSTRSSRRRGAFVL